MKTPKEHHADLERLARLIEAGDLTPTIERTYPLDQAPDAMRHLQAGHARGKLAITVTDGYERGGHAPASTRRSIS